MLCENCNKNIATVHLTEISNKVKKDVHLCDECAQEKGLSIKNAHFTISDLLGGLVGDEDKGAGRDRKRGKDPVCKVCGMKYSEFKSSGRLGCPACYDSFERGLVPLLNKIHQSDRHAGKLPGRACENIADQQELLALRKELAAAVGQEEYEKAAALRDSIRRLEVKHGEDGDGC